MIYKYVKGVLAIYVRDDDLSKIKSKIDTIFTSYAEKAMQLFHLIKLTYASYFLFKHVLFVEPTLMPTTEIMYCNSCRVRQTILGQHISLRNYDIYDLFGSKPL